MGLIQSAAPPLETILKEALEPHTLEDVARHQDKLHRLTKLSKSGGDVRLSAQDISDLEEMINFLGKLTQYSSKERRAEWFASTFMPTKKPPEAIVAAESTSRGAWTNVRMDSMNDEMARLNKVVKETEEENQKLKRRLSTSPEAGKREKERLEQENKDLKRRLSANLAAGKQEKERLEQEIKDLKRSLSRSLETGKQEQEQLKQENKDLKRSLFTANEEKERLRHQSEDFRLRLAKEMSDKVAADESTFENVNIKNRPMKVAEDYQQFCTTSWLPAKEQLDKAKIPQMEALKTLSELLKTAETYAQIKQQEVTHSIYSVFSQQASHGAELLGPLTPQSKMPTVEVKKIPSGLKNAIGDFLRTTADTADISGIVKEILKETVPTADVTLRTTMRGVENPDKLSVNYLQLEEYMKDCARLAWKMVVQRPPMTFDIKSGVNEAWEGDKYQDVFFSSKDPKQPGNVVLFYVYPRLKHKDAIMAKGCVFIGPKGD